MNVAEWLSETTQRLHTAGIETPRLDGLILLEDSLGMDRARILGHPEIVIPTNMLDTLDTKIDRRTRHEPLAYIRGSTEFYGRTYSVNNHVLIPRPETEMVIDVLLNLELPASSMIVDIGTGSGAIAITAKLELDTRLKSQFTGLRVVAVDIDEQCLRVARQNAVQLGADVEFRSGNLLEPVYPELGADAVILCNLPYVPEAYPINKAAGHEPALALYSGSTGLDHYTALYEQLAGLNERPEYVVTESLPAQHAGMREFGKRAGYTELSALDFVQLWKQSKD